MEGDFHAMMLQAQMLRRHNPNALNVAFASKKDVISGASQSHSMRKDSHHEEQNEEG